MWKTASDVAVWRFHHQAETITPAEDVVCLRGFLHDKEKVHYVRFVDDACMLTSRALQTTTSAFDPVDFCSYTEELKKPFSQLCVNADGIYWSLYTPSLHVFQTAEMLSLFICTLRASTEIGDGRVKAKEKHSSVISPCSFLPVCCVADFLSRVLRNLQLYFSWFPQGKALHHGVFESIKLWLISIFCSR